MTSKSSIRVMIVDDHQVIRDGVTAMLADCDDMVVTATAENATEALELCREVGVDVVLMDLAMPGMDGVTATARVQERFPRTRVVVLVDSPAEVPVRAAVQSGAMGCLLKTVGVDLLCDAIRGVMRGQSAFSSELLPLLVDGPRDQAAEPLTPRERDVLELLATGHTNKAIARALSLAEGTIRIYVSAILAKLGATNRTEATVLAIQQGLIDTP